MSSMGAEKVTCRFVFVACEGMDNSADESLPWDGVHRLGHDGRFDFSAAFIRLSCILLNHRSCYATKHHVLVILCFCDIFLLQVVVRFVLLKSDSK